MGYLHLQYLAVLYGVGPSVDEVMAGVPVEVGELHYTLMTVDNEVVIPQLSHLPQALITSATLIHLSIPYPSPTYPPSMSILLYQGSATELLAKIPPVVATPQTTFGDLLDSLVST